MEYILTVAMRRQCQCDPAKRARVLAERGFDLLDLSAVFDDPKRIDFADERIHYGEERRLTIGRSDGRFFTVVYTIRGDITWLITAWPSNRKERVRYG